MIIMLILGTHPESQHPSGVQGRFSHVEGGKDEMRARQKTKKKPIGFGKRPVHAFHTHCKTLPNLIKLFLALCLCRSKKTSSRTTKTGKLRTKQRGALLLVHVTY